MSDLESTASDYDDTEQASSFSNVARVRRRANVPMVQNVVLIWLDANIDEENSADCQHAVSQFRRVINTIHTFTDSDKCIEFIESKSNEKICMIISDSYGEHTVPRVHNTSQVDSIFILCDNINHHEQWVKDWSKIKGVFSDVPPICDALKEVAHECEQNSIGISFMATTGDVSNKNLNQLDCSFMYTQIMKEILLSIHFEQTHIQEFIDYCHDAFTDNEKELRNVKRLQRKYHQKTPIWWYTCESFLYPMLNRALRVMDADIIIKMGFFIGDLHRHIEQLHSLQFDGHDSSATLTVYRGHGMSKTDFEHMTKIKNGLMSFNNFLSTSKNYDVSLRFARKALRNPDLMGILFMMTIDPSLSTTPFASVTDISCIKTEDELLFSMHTVFRIRDIKSMVDNDRLFQVDLILTSENDPDLRTLTDRIREETEGSTGWHQLGKLLLKIGESREAQPIYELMLHQPNDDSEKADIYHHLGSVEYAQGQYEEAITFYNKSFEIRQKTLPPNDPSFGKSYNHIGIAYDAMGDYLKALSSHEKALAIRQQSLPPNHPDLASTYTSIGIVYDNMGDYSKALSYYEKGLEIDQKSLPPNHPDLAKSYANIGNVYHSMGDYSKALLSHEKGLEINQKSLPPNHPDLASTYTCIGNVYYGMGDYSKALSSYEKDLGIKQQSLPPTHPDLASTYNNIGNVYSSTGDYSKAFSSHEKALAIQQQSLPPDHPDLAKSYTWIGNVYYSMGDYSKALSYYEKDLATTQKSLPPNHPDLASIYNNIGNVYNSTGDYSKALSSHEKALAIRQQSLPPDHPDWNASYSNIGNVYCSMHEYSKALVYYEKSFAVQQQSLPPNHPSLALTYGHIGNVYYNMSEYSKSLLFCERAVEIGQHSLPLNHSHLQWYKNNLDRVKQKL